MSLFHAVTEVKIVKIRLAIRSVFLSEKKYLNNTWKAVVDFFTAENGNSRFSISAQLLDLKQERRHVSATACALQTR